MAALVTAAVVITDPQEARALQKALDLLREREVRNGMTWPRELAALHTALGEISAERLRTLLRTSEALVVAERAPTMSVESDTDAMLDTKNAAERLGLTERHVRRMTQALGGFRTTPRGPWWFPSENIEAAVAARRSAA